MSEQRSWRPESPLPPSISPVTPPPCHPHLATTSPNQPTAHQPLAHRLIVRPTSVAGCSRSVCLVLMHLMVHHGVYLRDGWEHMKSVRPHINPNEGFKLALAK